MLGFIVKHKKLGLGKIVELHNRRITIQFVNGEKQTLGSAVLDDGWLTRTNLGNGHFCEGPRGSCTINQILSIPGKRPIPCNYEVTYLDGLRSQVSEVDLIPKAEPVWTDPLSRLKSLAHQSLYLFQTREKLAKAFNKMFREGAGLRALLSSRIDLHAHQAYVAGRVLLDSTRRYLLADEVGLGKTIEAGIIISDLLAQKPDARVLVLCPAALTQQWFCELYSKFGGHIFTLLDVGGRTLSARQIRKSICSTTQATYNIPETLQAITWDMVVVDEVHQLLSASAIYSFVQNLSKNTSSLLLLSAIPAQRREDDFFRLLALLDPKRYDAESEQARIAFRSLYAAQEDIGRRLRLFSRRIEAMSGEDPGGEKVIEFAPRFLQIPVLEADQNIGKVIANLERGSADLQDQASGLLHYIADNYRINRRILRNRRQRLLETGQLAPISRNIVAFPYTPDPTEIDLLNSIEAIINTLRESGVPTEHLAPFVRVAIQSLVLPTTALAFLEALQEEQPEKLNRQGDDFISIGYMFGYQDWDIYSGLVCKAVRGFLPSDLLSRSLRSANAWYAKWPHCQRISKLLDLLRQKRKTDPACKLIIFAGYPGAARELFEFLQTEVGEKHVTCFRDDLDQDIKEENARKFQGSAQTWILVSDESGGEGRNFQFADEIIHFDTPWYAARIEQRIGRLDRLGRERFRMEVTSNVLFCENTKEEALVRCYSDGLGVYSESISGLEFALRQVETQIATAATNDGTEEMIALVPRLAELAVQERAADESEAVLDEASFEARSAERFRRVSQSANLSADLEKCFVEYFRAISVNKSTKQIAEPGFREGIWRFFADDTKFEPLPRLDKNAEGLFGEFRGTFRRDIAQRRTDLQFFNVGNPFFDSVISTLTRQTTARVYGVSCSSLGGPTWTGLEFAFTAQPDMDVLAENYGLVNYARGLFTLNRKVIFIHTNGSVAERPLAKSLYEIRGSLTSEKRNRSWWNLTDEKSNFMLDAIGEKDWPTFVQELYAIAEVTAKRHFEEKLGDRLQLEHERIHEQRRQLNLRRDQDSVRESANLQIFEFAIDNWKVELDCVGFLSVNDIRIT